MGRTAFFDPQVRIALERAAALDDELVHRVSSSRSPPRAAAGLRGSPSGSHRRCSVAGPALTGPCSRTVATGPHPIPRPAAIASAQRPRPGPHRPSLG